MYFEGRAPRYALFSLINIIFPNFPVRNTGYRTNCSALKPAPKDLDDDFAQLSHRCFNVSISFLASINSATIRAFEPKEVAQSVRCPSTA